MIDPRRKLKQELMVLGIDAYKSTLISLDAGSSQCVVDEEYLRDIKIEEKNFNRVYQKIIDFYFGDLNEY